MTWKDETLTSRWDREDDLCSENEVNESEVNATDERKDWYWEDDVPVGVFRVGSKRRMCAMWTRNHDMREMQN